MTFQETIDLFEALVDDHRELKGFLHGPVEMLISESRSQLEYPCLMLEHPPATLSKNGDSVQLARPISFVILINLKYTGSASVEFSSQLEAYRVTEELCLDVITRLHKMSREQPNSFRIELDQADLAPISTLFVDNDCGWRVEFRMKEPLSLCDRPQKWASTYTP